MSFTIASIQNSKLRALATTVDSTFNGKTKGNKVIDDCEIPVFAAQAKAKGLGNEYQEFLKINKQPTKTEAADSTNKATTEDKFDIEEAYTKLTGLEKQVQTAKTKVNNLRKKLAELEKLPSYKEKYQGTGTNIGKWTLGGICGLATMGIVLAADDAFLAMIAVLGGTLVSGGAALIGGAIGLGVGTAVYYMSKSDKEEKAYNDNIKNQIEKVKKDLKAAELQLQKYELALQHFNNNI